MDSDHISPALLKAGSEYLAALKRLHLDPEGLLWSRVNETRDIDDGHGYRLPSDVPDGDWHLVLITSAIDEAGPLAMQDMLFKAYNLSATPQDISPFIVEVMSARSPFYAGLLRALNTDVPLIFGGGPDGRQRSVADTLDHPVMVYGLWFDRQWIYQLTGFAPLKHRQRRSQWLDFRQSVNALAA
jgi:hypothetical protein